MMHVQSHATQSTPNAFPFPPGSGDGEVKLHHLKTHSDIRAVLHLRDGIDLSAAHRAEGEAFDSLEKKRRVGFCRRF